MVWNYLVNLLFPLGAAAVLGGLVGLEREYRGQWAGLRTHLMVSLGSATFLLIGNAVTEASRPELSRVIQGIATGVGFIGAGTILKRQSELEVMGLTTASSIWASAAIGVAAALRMYALAITAAAFALFALFVLHLAERRMDLPGSNGEAGAKR